VPDENQLEAKRDAAKKVWSQWSNATDWSEESGDSTNEAYESRRAAAKAAWSKWGNAAGGSDDSEDDPEKE
jgi:hypothetical protein